MAEITKLGKCIIQDIHTDVKGKLVVGANTVIGYEVWIETHEHDYEDDNWPYQDEEHTLVIGEQVYIGARAMILGGCKFIADGVLIGAGSVVAKNISEPWTKWVGNPAIKIGNRKQVNAEIK